MADKILKHARETIKKTFPQYNRSAIPSYELEKSVTIVGWKEMKELYHPERIM